ncbi:MAG TPA: glycine zipper 2TM domain-containing protein [Novosphingobium sp.]|jgi:osmotically inducible lipoprotein OsmB|nr:glycine zipper 2TM domain-containing protein [Novosphingobium sp.]
MTSKLFGRASLAAAVAALALTANPAEARTCKRLNKTEGAAVGAVAGGVLGAVLTGGTTAGVLGGAAVGGIGGHEIARTKYNRHCRRYYRR